MFISSLNSEFVFDMENRKREISSYKVSKSHFHFPLWKMEIIFTKPENNRKNSGEFIFNFSCLQNAATKYLRVKSRKGLLSSDANLFSLHISFFLALFPPFRSGLRSLQSLSSKQQKSFKFRVRIKMYKFHSQRYYSLMVDLLNEMYPN